MWKNSQLDINRKTRKTKEDIFDPLKDKKCADIKINTMLFNNNETYQC